MKKELRKEAEAAKLPAEKAKEASEEFSRILKLIKAAYERQQEQKKIRDSEYKGGRTEQSEAYDEMRKALYATQKEVEVSAN